MCIMSFEFQDEFIQMELCKTTRAEKDVVRVPISTSDRIAPCSNFQIPRQCEWIIFKTKTCFVSLELFGAHDRTELQFICHLNERFRSVLIPLARVVAADMPQIRMSLDFRRLASNDILAIEAAFGT